MMTSSASTGEVGSVDARASGVHARRLRRRGRHFYDRHDFIPFLLFSLFLNYVFVLDFSFVLFFFPFSFRLFSRLFYLPNNLNAQFWYIIACLSTHDITKTN